MRLPIGVPTSLQPFKLSQGWLEHSSPITCSKKIYIKRCKWKRQTDEEENQLGSLFFASSFSNCVEELRNSVQLLQYQQKKYGTTVKERM